MVLQELGRKISQALQDFGKKEDPNEDALKVCLNRINYALLEADVDKHLVQKLSENIKVQFKFDQSMGGSVQKVVNRAVVEELTRLLECDRKQFIPPKGRSSVVMFVGLQGAGKTTTCAKYAYYWTRKNYRVAMVCADTFRAGAFDQLKQNATKIRVPFYGSYSETDPVVIAREGVALFKKEGFEVIIVDTSGRHRQEDDLFEEMKQMKSAVKPNDVVFVMDSSIGQACYSQASAFKKAVKVGSVIVTKLDGHAKGGGALSAVAATDSPIIFLGEGEHFTDLEPFNGASFVKRLLGLGDIDMMVKLVKNAAGEQDQLQMMSHIQEGKFSLNDLKIQYKSALNLGPLNQFASMIPGLGNQLVGKGSEKENVDRIKIMLIILDSMTKEELNGTVQLVDSRKKRIARGAGAFPEELEALLANYKSIKKTIENFSQLKMGDNVSALLRNPKQLQENLMRGINPSMMQQLGGMENLMEMFKQYKNLEQKGELKEFNKMLKDAKKNKNSSK